MRTLCPAPSSPSRSPTSNAVPKRSPGRSPRPGCGQAFDGTEVTPAGDGELDIELTLNGREVIARGRARAPVTLPDARSLDPVPLTLEPEIFLLLAPAAEPDPRIRHPARHPRDPHGARKDHPRGHKKKEKKTGSGKRGGWDADPLLPDEDAARDTYSGERVVLDNFVREFLLLELPMSVTRSDLPRIDYPASPPPSGGPDPKAEEPIDPRLAPLAAIASRLRQNKE